MKTLNLLVLSGSMATILVAAGCTKSPDRARVDPERRTPGVSEVERPGSDARNDISAATAKLRVSDLKVGPVLGGDGAVVENVDEVAPGQALHASVAVGDIGAGSSLKAVWLGPEGLRLAEEIKAVGVGAAFVSFAAPDTSKWIAGNYKLEIYLGDELASSDGFDVVVKPAY